MATKQKQEKTSKKPAQQPNQTKLEERYQVINLVTGLLTVFIAGLALFDGGLVGVLFANTFRLLVGSSYKILLVLAGFWGLFLIVRGRIPNLGWHRYLGLVLMFFAMTTVLHVNNFGGSQPQDIFDQTYRLFVNDLITNQNRTNIGGGMMGAAGYFAFGFLFGKWGTYIFASLLFITGGLMVLSIPISQLRRKINQLGSGFKQVTRGLIPNWSEVKEVFNQGQMEPIDDQSLADDELDQEKILVDKPPVAERTKSVKKGLSSLFFKQEGTTKAWNGSEYQPSYQPKEARSFDPFDPKTNPVINRIAREEKILDLDYFDQVTNDKQSRITVSKAWEDNKPGHEVRVEVIQESVHSNKLSSNLNDPSQDRLDMESDLTDDQHHLEPNLSQNLMGQDDKDVTAKSTYEDRQAHSEASHWQKQATEKQDLMVDDMDRLLSQADDQETGNQNLRAKKKISGSKITLPGKSLLKKIPPVDQSEEYARINVNIEKLERTFESFGVKAKVVRANLGPSVTKYEIEPAIGVKVSKIVSLSDDIALALAARDVRMEAPIPGKSLIGIEVPNTQVSPVSFWEIIDAALESPNILEVPMGRDISGSVCLADLSKMPHLLIAGATGSGKSVGMNVIIVSLLMKAQPDEVKFLMIDPKKVELTMYDDLPHLLTPVVTNPRKAAQALNKVVQEMERRYELFAASNVRNIDGYNEMVDNLNKEASDTVYQRLPKIVVFVDELADLMMVASNDVENAIIRLAQMARAAGIHMIIATQRPSVDVITGIIKANVPSRLAFAVSSGTDSRTILDSVGAEKLLGRGDMLFQPMGKNKPVRVQGAYISDAEVERITNFIKDQQVANYDESLINLEEETDAGPAASEDEYFQDAADMLEGLETISISQLQRRFRIGYNRAARLIDDLEAAGLVSGQDGSKPRQVL